MLYERTCNFGGIVLNNVDLVIKNKSISGPNCRHDMLLSYNFKIVFIRCHLFSTSKHIFIVVLNEHYPKISDLKFL